MISKLKLKFTNYFTIYIKRVESAHFWGIHQGLYTKSLSTPRPISTTIFSTVGAVFGQRLNTDNLGVL